MALSILDGTQTATTLSTILSSGQHITAHTVVSLGTQAMTDILSAVSSGIAISGTVTAMTGGETPTSEVPLFFLGFFLTMTIYAFISIISALTSYLSSLKTDILFIIFGRSLFLGSIP